jgi:hypothetical protein
VTSREDSWVRHMVNYFENSLLISNSGVRRNLGTLSAFA